MVSASLTAARPKTAAVARRDAAVRSAVDDAVGAGMVGPGGNRKALRVRTGPRDGLCEYRVVNAREQAAGSVEKHLRAKEHRL